MLVQLLRLATIGPVAVDVILTTLRFVFCCPDFLAENVSCCSDVWVLAVTCQCLLVR